MKTNKVCIIGAGSSGIAACKVLQEYGIEFDCFEKGSKIGGNWRYNNDNGMSSAYWSLHINTSRDKMCYSDFPMPSDYPDFPHHTQIIQYFEDYVDHFGFRDKIIFHTQVTEIWREADDTYTVATDRGVHQNYRALIVANGHHWNPRFPEPPFPGHFEGEIMHSHFYKTPEIFQPNKNVVILGIGNSALDIACEAARTTRGSVVLSTRSGAHIVPKYILGVPLDQFGSREKTSFLPLSVQQFLYKTLLNLSRGKQETYGVPTPKRKFLTEHPSISQDFLPLAGHGKIKVRPNIQRLNGKEVIFEDGSSAQADILIYATGYKVSFPFFKNGMFDVEKDNDLQLYHRVVHPDIPNLFFLGLVQPLGAIMPIAERQSQWIAKLLTGEVALPSKKYMNLKIRKIAEEVNRQYKQSPRHTLQVDFYVYMHQLKKEMQQMRTKEGKNITPVSQ
ncbi:MAG: NAD(P)-binding domain-containing protein [Microscillaceae bacterium]|nr:NAD(P)-binding domain-containing protein [Microscillaceae bacterium]